MARTYTTYKDKVSGETLYTNLDQDRIAYYKDKSMTIYHRRDGPAIEYADEYKAWYGNGTLHRLDGPAIEYADGYKVWLVNGVTITLISSSGEYEGPTLLQDLQDDL